MKSRKVCVCKFLGLKSRKKMGKVEKSKIGRKKIVGIEKSKTFCEKERSEVESICFSLLFTLFREIPMSVGPNVQGPFWFVA